MRISEVLGLMAKLVGLESRVSTLESSSEIPVGGVYMNVTGINPATELGYGTWSEGTLVGNTLTYSTAP